MLKLEAIELQPGRWGVRPQGCLGSCGWLDNGTPWQIEYVHARSAEAAIIKVENEKRKERRK